MTKNKKIVIVGATSAIATQCAKLWLSAGVTELFLVGRDYDRLNRVASDLKSRHHQCNIEIISTDLNDPNSIQKTVDDIAISGIIDLILIAHGSLSDQQLCQLDLERCADELQINAISPVIFAEAFSTHLGKNNHGTLAIISSVAGDRGRKSNYIYGSAKGLVTRYTQGLQHRFANTNVKVVLIKPGPTDTPMTAALKAKGAKLASVEDVAQTIVKAIDRGAQTVYTPGKWAIIMMIIRHLPAFIFNKLNI